MTGLLVLLTIAAGIAISLQIGVNNALRASLGAPVIAALLSFLVGSVCLLAYALLTRAPWPQAQAVAKAPWWAWLGGALGAYYVVITIVAAPRLGAASLVSIIVAAQLMSSLALDHFGWVGFTQHAINAWRIAGALLLVAGVFLIVRN